MTTTQQPTPTLTPEQALKQARVLAVGTGADAVDFAQRIPNADIPALQARVLEVGSGWDLNFCHSCAGC